MPTDYRSPDRIQADVKEYLVGVLTGQREQYVRQNKRLAAEPRRSNHSNHDYVVGYGEELIRQVDRLLEVLA